MTVQRGRSAHAVTLADVAREAGVSSATASFVLSGRNGRRSAGSAETKRRVREAAERLGYMPNRYARAMRTGRSNAVILALGTAGDPWGISLVRAVRERAVPRGLSTAVLADETWFEFLSGYASDVAFVSSADESPEAAEQVRRLAHAGIEIVAFSERITPDGFDVVKSSALPAVRSAYRVLRGRHERVSFLTTSPFDPDVPTYPPHRGIAFVRAAREQGDEASAASCVATGSGQGRSMQACLEWLAGPDRPTAVVCSTGYLALALQAAARHLGIAVPDQLEIVSIGDVPAEAQFLEPVSFYGVDDVFERIADILIAGAVTPGRDGPGTLHEFTWRFFPGTTTRDE